MLESPGSTSPISREPVGILVSTERAARASHRCLVRHFPWLSKSRLLALALIWALVLEGSFGMQPSQRLSAVERTPFEAVRGEVLHRARGNPCEVRWRRRDGRQFDRASQVRRRPARSLRGPNPPYQCRTRAEARATSCLRRASSTGSTLLNRARLFGLPGSAQVRTGLVGSVRLGAPEARRDAASALHHAAAQGAKPVAAASRVYWPFADDGAGVVEGAVSRGGGTEFPWTLSMLAEILVERLDVLDGPAAELIGQGGPPQTDQVAPTTLGMWWRTPTQNSACGPPS